MRKAQLVNVGIRPKVKELKTIYKGLLTTSVIHRIEALKKALQWYDQSVAYLKERPAKRGGLAPSSDNLRLEDEAFRYRKNAINTRDQTQKERHLIGAVKTLERLCKTLRPPPFAQACEQHVKYHQKIKRRRERMEQKYFVVTNTLREALQPQSSFGEPLSIFIDDVDKARGFSRSGDEFGYNRSTAQALQKTLRRDGVLPFVLQELKPLSRAGAMEDDGEGHFKVNPERQVEVIFQMLDNLVAYATKLDRPKRLKLVRQHHEEAEHEN